MLNEFVRLFRSHQIIAYLIDQEQKVQHRDKLLGNVWMLLNPIMMMVVLFFVFAELRHIGVTFCLYLFSGLLAWDILTKCLVGCTVSLHSRKDLIHKFPMPLSIFPTAVVLHKVYDVLCGLFAYLGIYIFIMVFFTGPIWPGRAVLFFPLWVFFYLMLLLGIGFALARIGVYFADIRDILDIVLRLGFFINPVFLEVGMFSQRVQKFFFFCNPVCGYMIYFRQVLPGGDLYLKNYQIPIPHYPLYLAGVTVAIFLIGFAFFLQGDRQYTKYL